MIKMSKEAITIVIMKLVIGLHGFFFLLATTDINMADKLRTWLE